MLRVIHYNSRSQWTHCKWVTSTTSAWFVLVVCLYIKECWLKYVTIYAYTIWCMLASLIRILLGPDCMLKTHACKLREQCNFIPMLMNIIDCDRLLRVEVLAEAISSENVYGYRRVELTFSAFRDSILVLWPLQTNCNKHLAEDWSNPTCMCSDSCAIKYFHMSGSQITICVEYVYSLLHRGCYTNSNSVNTYMYHLTVTSNIHFVTGIVIYYECLHGIQKYMHATDHYQVSMRYLLDSNLTFWAEGKLWVTKQLWEHLIERRKKLL